MDIIKDIQNIDGDTNRSIVSYFYVNIAKFGMWSNVRYDHMVNGYRLGQGIRARTSRLNMKTYIFVVRIFKFVHVKYSVK